VAPRLADGAGGGGRRVAALGASWDGAASGRPYALALLDARMPDKNGLTLAAMVREKAERSAVHISLLTSGERLGDLASLGELAIDAHLLKPLRHVADHRPDDVS
jgi:two-component system, sensor histidine kinase and response regulator